jgi:hypothetical protein
MISKNLNSLVGLALGLIVYCIVIGIEAIRPSNVGWLMNSRNSDLFLNYLGWEFYRSSSWTFPLGVIENYGDGITTTVVHTDSIPLLAIPLKLITGLLPDNFQYFGIWLCLSFVMQGYFSWKILEKYRNSILINVCCVLLFLFVPAMLIRTNLHIALSSHFLILAAIYLYLSRTAKYKRGWSALLPASLLIHPYLLAMVYGVFVAYLLANRYIPPPRKLRIWLGESAVLTAIGYVIGYFAIPSSVGKREVSWGIYRWNLASPFNPDGWSTFLQYAPRFEGNLEGFSYLGIGWIFLFVFAASGVKGIQLFNGVRNNKSLSLIAALSFLFAMTNQISVANIRMSVQIPSFLVDVFGTFRSSGRMIWLPLYLLMIICLIRIFSSQKKMKIAQILIPLLAFVQVVDTHKGWQDLNFRRFASEKFDLVINEKWSELSQKFDTILVVPDGNENFNWPTIGFIASRYEMKTNSIYLARVNSGEITKQREKILYQLKSNQLHEKSIYVLSDEQLRAFRETVQKKNVVSEKVDEMNLVYRS